MPKIEIYTQPGCPFCVRAVALFKKKSLEFTEINAPHGTKEREESIQRSGRRTVPQIFINENHIGGCDDVMSLESTGKLDMILGRS